MNLTPSVPLTAPESDQDEAALKDNAERVESNDWIPVVLPGSVANATTNIGGIVSMGASMIGGLAVGTIAQELRDEEPLAPIKNPYRLAPADPVTGTEDSTTGGVVNGRDEG